MRPPSGGWSFKHRKGDRGNRGRFYFAYLPPLATCHSRKIASSDFNHPYCISLDVTPLQKESPRLRSIIFENKQIGIGGACRCWKTGLMDVATNMPILTKKICLLYLQNVSFKSLWCAGKKKKKNSHSLKMGDDADDLSCLPPLLFGRWPVTCWSLGLWKVYVGVLY